MDPVTHAVLARMAVSLGGRSLAPARNALPVIAGLAPDVDALLMPVGWDLYLRVHESGTHTVVGGLVLSAVLAGAARARMREPIRPLFAAAVIGVFSHIVLDVLAGATIQPGWPLIPHRTAAGLVGMADPWVVAVVVVALALMTIRRWPLRVLATFTFVVLAMLLTGKYGSRRLALGIYESVLTAEVERRYVVPRWGSLGGWWVYDRAGERMRMWRIDLRAHTATVVLDLPVAGTGSMVAGEHELGTVRNFLHSHDLPLRVSVPTADGTRVFWSDLRFCWRATNEARPAPGSRIRPSPDPVVCALWFGGDLDGSGTSVREFVNVGDWVQER